MACLNVGSVPNICLSHPNCENKYIQATLAIFSGFVYLQISFSLYLLTFKSQGSEIMVCVLKTTISFYYLRY